MADQQNLFAGLPATRAALPDELIETLAATGDVRIERIVSFGHASPKGYWYDQAQAEWVVVLSGRAVLAFADAEVPCRLGPGEWVLIPPHRRHRVTMTDPAVPTVWLAVHLGAAGGPG